MYMHSGVDFVLFVWLSKVSVVIVEVTIAIAWISAKFLEFVFWILSKSLRFEWPICTVTV